MSKSTLLRPSLATVMGLCMALPAYSQTSGGPELEEIVVTARRVEERATDVPISMAVFNQTQISNANLTNAGDLAKITPSLSTNDNYGSENSTYAIRGFVQDSGTAPSVGVYFADVVAPRGPTNGLQAGDGAGPGYFFDLQNIQVLKGPQGTLQGRNTTGGAVLFVPQKPTSQLGGYAEISAGNYGMKRVEAAVNLPISDTARFRLAVDRQERNGYVKNNSGIGPDEFNNINYFAARASLVVDLTPNLENYLIASFSRSHTNGPLQKVIACDPTNQTFAGLACPQTTRNAARGDDFYTAQSDLADPKNILRTWQGINTTTWHATDTLTLKNIISYAQLSDDLRAGLFGTDWRAGPLVLPFSYAIAPPGGKAADQSTFTEELQLNGNAMDSRLTFQGGAYFESSKPLSKVGFQSPVLANCVNFSSPYPAGLGCVDPLGIGFSQALGFPIHVGSVNYTVGETTTRDIGLYQQSSFAITDKLKLTAGYRYTWDEQSNVSQRISYRFPVTAPFTDPPTTNCANSNSVFPCMQFQEAKSSSPTWLLNFDFKPTDDMLLYASYKRGYRAGGTFVNAPASYPTFSPEKVDTYELGYKAAFRGELKGTFSAAAFYNDFSNQQLQIGFDAVPGSGQSSTTAIVNAGKSQIYGVEVDASITPITGLTFGVDYTYLNTKLKSIDPVVSTDPQYSTIVSLEKGDPLVLSPKNKYAITGTYTLPLPAPIGKVSVGVNFVHTDKQLSNYVYLHSPAVVTALGGDYGTLKERNLVNANAGWNDIVGLPLDVSLFVTNLTNQRYYSFVAGLVGAGFESVTLAEPRMYGARLRYKF